MTPKKNEFVKTAATAVAEKSLQKAKSSSGWARVLWGIGTAIAAAVAWLCGTASQNQPEPTDTVPTLSTPEGLEPLELD
jgi:hypothetical protein